MTQPRSSAYYAPAAADGSRRLNSESRERHDRTNVCAWGGGGNTLALWLTLLVAVGVALIATGYGVAQLTSVETEVRVVARPHEDGRVEFAVQQRVDGEWGERIAPSSRYLTPTLIEQRVGRWLNSSPITLTVAIDGAPDELSEPPSQPNRAPTASAGPDSAYDLGAIVAVLTGLDSQDPDGDSLTYEWTQTAGPAVTLDSPSSATPRFESPRAEQTLTFQLRVTDGGGASDTDTVTVKFVNLPPISNAGPDLDVGRGHEVMLQGSGSDDAQGDTLIDTEEDGLVYRWSQVSGSLVELSDPDSATPTFTAPNEPDQLVFSLTVSDGQLESDPSTVTVTVHNTRPIANAGADQYVNRRQKVTLPGSGSDEHGDNLTYRWSQVSGPQVTLSDTAAVTPTFTTPNAPARFVFSLTVSDGLLESRADTVTVTVRNTRPIANAGPDREVTGGARIALNGTASTDPDGDRLTYRWTQTRGDEVRLTNPSASRPSFAAPRISQTLIFQLEVSDGHDSAIDTVQVSVSDAPITLSGRGDDAQTMGRLAPGVYFCDIGVTGNSSRYDSRHFSVWMHGRDGGSELAVNEITYVSPWSVRRRIVVGDNFGELRGVVDVEVSATGQWTITCTRQGE